VYMYMCPIPNGFRDRPIHCTVLYTVRCTDEQHAMSSHELQSALMLTVEFSKMCATRKTVPTLSLEQQIPVLETVRNISFLSTILELYSGKPFQIRHMYIHNFLPRTTDTMTPQNTDLSSWDILHTYAEFPERLFLHESLQCTCSLLHDYI
jgi:hypothetical protein